MIIRNPSASEPAAISDEDIEGVVLQALRNANMARELDAQLPIAPDASIFGPDSPLDSLGLVALLLDIEDGLRDRGLEVVLSDDRAVSQKRSPFRSVPSLVAYISAVARG